MTVSQQSFLSAHMIKATVSEIGGPFTSVCLRLCAVCLAVSAVIGVVGGVILVMSWWRFGSVMACIVVVGLMLGFLVASTVLFTPLGREIKKTFSSSNMTPVNHYFL